MKNVCSRFRAIDHDFIFNHEVSGSFISREEIMKPLITETSEDLKSLQELVLSKDENESSQEKKRLSAEKIKAVNDFFDENGVDLVMTQNEEGFVSLSGAFLTAVMATGKFNSIQNPLLIKREIMSVIFGSYSNGKFLNLRLRDTNGVEYVFTLKKDKKGVVEPLLLFESRTEESLSDVMKIKSSSSEVQDLDEEALELQKYAQNIADKLSFIDEIVLTDNGRNFRITGDLADKLGDDITLGKKAKKIEFIPYMREGLLVGVKIVIDGGKKEILLYQKENGKIAAKVNGEYYRGGR